MEKTFECLKDIIEEQIKQISKKGEAITAQEMTSLKDALKALNMIEERQGRGQYSEGGYQYGEGYQYGAKRSPVTGRYISSGANMQYGRAPQGGNMYGHSIKDRMIARLEPMYDEASTEHERQVIMNTINRIQSEK